MDWKKIGPLSFLVGIALAIIGAILPLLGLTGLNTVIAQLLILLGFIVGLMNITVDEEVKFLLSGLALLFMGVGLLKVFEMVPVGGDVLTAVLNNIITFASPAIGVVALKVMLEIMRD